jgi:polysaccharide chain length determinant protein (PEP-CTERM system associated)
VLPGKKYTPEDIARLALRRAWFIVLPLVVGTALALVAGRYLPKKYRSETLIMVVPQRIPQSYVKAGGTENIEDRLATLQDQILSRSRLEKIILDLNLYQSLRQKLPMEDVVQRMRTDITITTNITKDDNSESASFKIAYVGEDPGTVQQATERLASLFIEENLRDRENIAESTTQFLESQLEDARQRLESQEKKLEAYRQRYSGELPTQEASAMQAVQTLQMQLQTLGDATDRARERRILLERQIADLELPDAAPAVPPAAETAGIPVVLTTAQQLEAARARLQVLLTHDTPDHPDVRTLQRIIRDLEAKQQTETKSAGTGAAAGQQKIVTPAEALKESRRRDLKAQLDAVDQELLDKQQQDKRLRQEIADYQGKLAAMPSRETDLVALTRDYTTVQKTYQDLLAKREESKLAANLEHRSIGEQFRVLDPAQRPAKPFSPNKLIVIGAGAAGGLAIGLLFIGFLEYRASGFGSEAEMIRLCQLPVLAVIPEMTSDDERKARRLRLVLANVACVVVVLAFTAVAVFAVKRF